MKIYTKTGDNGTTQLIGGQRVKKNDVRVSAYGTLDELNAFVGWALSVCPEASSFQTINNHLIRIQNELFIIGSHLACQDPTFKSQLPLLPKDAVLKLESWIDEMTSQLPPLKNFILPGGSPLGAALHLARTVCRRAERDILFLDEQSYEPFITYLNRLSDAFFVAARMSNSLAKVTETLWQPQ